jgi:NAD(P)-dependent dehydrogenase (short-subunit alcohol dehydrogenase family)
MADERFTGRVLFATGGGSGIAAATARRFAAEGGRVAVVDLDGDRARAVADELDGSCAIACDVSDERSVQQAVDEAVQRLGRIDCVLNAAGHVHFAPLEQVSLEEWNRMLAVHLTGTFLVCRATLPALRMAGGGSVVNLSSVTALVARTNLAAYSSVKGAILSLSRQLALDLAVDNVRVNAIAPGSVRTPMTQPVYGDEGGSPGHSARPDSIQKRVAEPEEIAATACFLFSEDASFLTGTLLVADGGSTAI